jgi:hypothetical protein
MKRNEIIANIYMRETPRNLLFTVTSQDKTILKTIFKKRTRTSESAPARLTNRLIEIHQGLTSINCNSVYVNITGSHFFGKYLAKFLVDNHIKIIKIVQKQPYAYNGCRPNHKPRE